MRTDPVPAATDRIDAAQRATVVDAPKPGAPGPRFAELLQRQQRGPAAGDQATARRADAAHPDEAERATASSNKPRARTHGADQPSKQTQESALQVDPQPTDAPVAASGLDEPVQDAPPRNDAAGEPASSEDNAATAQPTGVEPALRALAPPAEGSSGSPDAPASIGAHALKAARGAAKQGAAEPDARPADAKAPEGSPTMAPWAEAAADAVHAQIRPAASVAATGAESTQAAGATLALQRPADVALPSAVASASLPAALDSPGFGQLLGAQVSLFARDGLQQAELRLNPPEMGPIGVQIEISGSDARVNFHAGQAVTRDAIERALPELAAALRGEGLTLTGGGVFDRPSDTRHGADSRGRSGAPLRAAHTGTASPALAAPMRSAAALGRVDLYA